MKHSRYNYIIPYHNDQFIFFNTLNTTLLLVDTPTYNKYISAHEFNLDDSDFKIFYENGMLVDDSLDEKAIVDFDRGQVVYSKDNRLYRILTTTGCNARCNYCYESGVAASFMSMDTAKNVVAYIKKHSQNGKEFFITWFGGEPLLNRKVIDYISAELTDYAAKTEKSWSAMMVSNGSLFNNETISAAKNKWNLQRVQITLDGTKENYEKIKAYTDHTHFEDIIKNIKALCSVGIYVSIRINYSRDNFNDVKDLITYLCKELKSYDHWSPYVYPIFDNKTGKYDDEYVLKFVELEKLIANVSGVDENKVVTLPQYRHGSCIYCTVAGESIMPNGDLMKCCRHMNKESPFGNISDAKIKYNSNYARWCSPVLPEKCNNCTLLPICQGGCRAEQLIGMDGCIPQAKAINQCLTTYVDNLLQRTQST